MTGLPDPPVPAGVTMTGNDWFPLYFDRLRKSKWWRRGSDMVRARNVMLWGEAYKAVPAGSLPDDDDELAEAAGFGMDVDAFLSVKAEIMEPWKLCSDGRWYHPTVCEVVMDAWNRLGDKRKDEATRKADYRKRVREGSVRPKKAADVPRDNMGQSDLSHGTDAKEAGQTPPVPLGLGQQTDRHTLEANASVGLAAPKPTKGEPWLSDPDFQRFWKSATPEARARTSQKKTWGPFEGAAKAAGGRSVIADAYARYLVGDPDVQRTGGPGLQRWLSDGRWEHWVPSPGDAEVSEDDWRTALRIWREDGSWLSRFGAKPGEPGCRVPAAMILQQARAAAGEEQVA